jgi:hypothetical protein
LFVALLENLTIGTMKTTVVCFFFIVASCFGALAPTDPAEQEPVFLSSLRTRSHDVAGDVYLVSERVLQIRNYVYDGTGPAAFFWMTNSTTPTRLGRIVADGLPSLGCAMDPDDAPLLAANNITQNVELPEGITIRDYLGGSFSVWCELFQANFGEIEIPESVSIPAISDILDCFEAEEAVMTTVPAIAATPAGFNCEPLNDNFQVRWQISNDILNVELVGCIEDGTYMGFGISGLPQTRTFMIGADAVVAVRVSAQTNKIIERELNLTGILSRRVSRFL